VDLSWEGEEIDLRGSKWVERGAGGLLELVVVGERLVKDQSWSQTAERVQWREETGWAG
jgi:hypothetical protein